MRFWACQVRLCADLDGISLGIRCSTPNSFQLRFEIYSAPRYDRLLDHSGVLTLSPKGVRVVADSKLEDFVKL